MPLDKSFLHICKIALIVELTEINKKVKWNTFFVQYFWDSYAHVIFICGLSKARSMDMALLKSIEQSHTEWKYIKLIDLSKSFENYLVSMTTNFLNELTSS